jgi:hypothetical protein
MHRKQSQKRIIDPQMEEKETEAYRQTERCIDIHRDRHTDRPEKETYRQTER